VTRPPPAADAPELSGARWVALLLVFTTLIATAVFGTRPLISYIALSLGAGTAELGIVASSFAVLAIAGAIPLGRSIDRLGERPVMIGGALLCVAVCAVLPFVRSLPGLAVGHALLGLGQMMAVVGAHTMLAHRGPMSRRAFRIGLYTSAASLGHAAGPAWVGITIGERVTPEGSAIALLGGSVAAALAAIAIALVKPERTGGGAGNSAEAGERRRASVGETLRLPGMVPALTAGIVALTAVDLLVAYLPAYGEERSITPQMIGFALAVLALAQMVSRLVLDRLLERFGHAGTLVASVLLAGLVIPALIAPIGEPALLVIMTIAGLGLGLAQPLTLVWVAIATPPGSRGLAMGVRMGGNRLGQLLIPVAVGATAGQLGVGAIFVTTAALLAGAAAYVVRERRMLTPEIAGGGGAVRAATTSAEP
jgi:MFS family permease